MLVRDIKNKLNLTLVAGENGLDKKVTSGFVGDLLSVVMGTAKPNCLWVTIQSHINIIAVATLANISCIIVSQGYELDEETIKKANEEEIPVFTTNLNSYEVVKELVNNGVE